MLSTLGELSFSVSPQHGDDIHLTVIVNALDSGDAFEIGCRYTPMPGETYDYFINSVFKLSAFQHLPGIQPRFHLSTSVMLRGTLSDKRASPVLRRVSCDLDRVTERLNKLSHQLREGQPYFKELLAWHLNTLEKDGEDLNISLRDRDFYVVMEVIGLALMGTRHLDPEVGDMAEYLLGAVFPEDLDVVA